MIRILPALLLLAWSLLAPAQDTVLPAPIAQALRQADIPDSHVGLVVWEIGAPAPELALGELRSFNPASVMKLVTTLAALDGLGPAHTWKTRAWVDGPIRDGVLDGNLILQGGGDPGLTLERFWLLLREIRAAGIREIRGDVILDDSYYAIEAVDPGAFDQAPLKPYNAAPMALLVNHNALELHLSPRDGELSARLSPALAAVAVEAQLGPESAGCDNGPGAIQVTRDEDGLRVLGEYPASCGERTMRLNVACPAATTAAYFHQLWADLGGVPPGQVRLGPVPVSARPLLEFASPPLALLARDVNKFSNNVMAKMLYLDLGAARFGAPATWDKAERAVREWLAARGLAFPELVLENGSGLSRVERLSVASTARLLAWAAGQPLYYEFAASLPALGREGTQKHRLPDSVLAGRAWLKSGSLNGARNLAGYVMDSAGRRKILVFFINHPNASRAGRVQEAVLEWAMAPPAGPVANSAGGGAGSGEMSSPRPGT